MGDPDALALSAHGLISDTATGALVAADGTVDWWCPGRFDGDAAFYQLLDPSAGGALRVGPSRAAPVAARQAATGTQTYDDRSNVVRTRLAAPGGEVEVADFMPWPGGTERPEGRIVRLVTGLRGPVEVAVELVPGRRLAPARQVAAWSGGVAFDGLAVRCGLEPVAVPLDRDRAVWVATTVLAPGERLVVTLDDLADDHHRPLSPDAAGRLLEDTSLAWRRHLQPVAYDGPYRAAVERSLLAVKALTYYGSGAPVAAPTMSLPEVMGGERNYDRRYAWISGVAAAATLSRRAGLVEEAEAAERWLRTVLEGADLPLEPVRDLEGGPAPGEEEVGLPGRRRSQPVRIGVLGADQDAGLQLDVYGEVVAAVVNAADGGPLSAVRGPLARMADWVADQWDQPDRGVWEVRSPALPLVSSRLQCWFALDRMARLARAHNPLDLDAVGWQQAAAAILRVLETDAQAGGGAEGGGRYDGRAGGLRRDLGAGDLPDAALLRVAWQGPWPPGHPVVTGTVERVVRQLSDGPYLRRYPPEMDDGAAGAPGADLVASFWAVRALAAVGEWEAAHERMEALCRPGPLGLLADGIDPLSGELTGNYPSSGAHLALVDTALALVAGPR